MIYYDTLLQNAADIITKCNSYFIKNTSSFLLQNTTVILQNATIITKRDDFIIKCNSCYKMRRLLQIATVQLAINIT